MPYVLSPPIHTKLPGLWGEGAPYVTESVYDIWSKDLSHPPVQYNAHTLKPHSITHIDFPGHTIPDGKTAENYFEGKAMRAFWGPTVVVRLEGEFWEEVQGDSQLRVWRVSKEQLQEACERVTGHGNVPSKVFMTTECATVTSDGFYDSRFILVLSTDAARWLVSSPDFNAFGTSWKSSDFEPGKRERPIHDILFSQAVLFEQLKLDMVPEGEYWLSGFPVYLAGATEAPVTPVLFTKDELWPTPPTT